MDEMKQYQPAQPDVRESEFHKLKVRFEKRYWESRQPFRNDTYSDDRVDRERMVGKS